MNIYVAMVTLLLVPISHFTPQSL